MLEVASALMEDESWPDVQTRIQLRPALDVPWSLCFSGSDDPATVLSVARGETQIAFINPAGVLSLAYRGTGPFPEPTPVRVIPVFPQFDQFGFAVLSKTGLTSLQDIRDHKYPLKVSIRGPRDHTVGVVARLAVEATGFSLDDIVAWGGEVRYDMGLPNVPHRLGAIERGEIDAVWDEAVPNWGDKALDLGMRFLPVAEPELQKLEALGLRRAVIGKAQHPRLPEEVWTVDFSGWPVYTRADVEDRIVTAFCVGIEARKDRIPFYGTGSLPLASMCQDTLECPQQVPLHPAAERFWRERGYLG